MLTPQALREVERERARERLVASDGKRMDIQYLKNVILKLYETGAPSKPMSAVGVAAREYSALWDLVSGPSVSSKQCFACPEVHGRYLML